MHAPWMIFHIGKRVFETARAHENGNTDVTYVYRAVCKPPYAPACTPNFLRYAPGLVNAIRRKCRRSDSSEPKPASSATRVMGNGVDASSSSRAIATRSRTSHS